MVANSERACVTALSIFSVASASTTSANSLTFTSSFAQRRRSCGGPSTDQRTDGLAVEQGPDVARLHQVEHDDRQPVLHTERGGRVIHHPEVTLEDVHVGDLVELGG